MKNKIVQVLQKLGRSFMLPISVLPAAGILLGVGSSFTNLTTLENLGLVNVIGPGTVIYSILSIMSGVGSAIFDNLPLIFAIGIAIGMVEKEKETAALAAALSYLVMNITINKILVIEGVIDASGTIINGSAEEALTTSLGIKTLQVGVFGGIVVGIIVSILHNKYHDIELPDFLAFFGGNRFVPIISIIVHIAVGFIFSVIWPIIQTGISALGNLVSSSGLIGVFLFTFIKRLLIPFGLHHIFYMPFWSTAVGGTAVIGGASYVGAQSILFAELADPNTLHISRSASMFFTGEFPMMIFGLPAVALAIYKNAKIDQKKEAKSLMLSAGLTSMVTGITEPLEFPIIFASPAIYVVYAFLSGLSNVACYLLNITIGCTFSCGLIDFLLFGVLPGNAKTSWVLMIPLGIVTFIVLYFIFDFAIKKFDLKTPGRQDRLMAIKVHAIKDDASELIVSALGGRDNIENVDCCATRLRINVKDNSIISEEELENTGALATFIDGNFIQIIYGAGVNLVKAKLDDYFSSDNSSSILIRTPIVGKYVKMEDVPDEAFSKKTMGDGVAVVPEKDIVYAPADGKITFTFPTYHAFGFKTKTGVSMLIHLGLDTVKLNGQGFTGFVKEGDEVKMGTPLVKLDLDYLNHCGLSMICPIVFTDLKENEKLEIVADEHIGFNESIVRIVKN